MKVSHLDQNHLLCLSSEEVALLMDLCHAGLFSDELGEAEGSSAVLRRFMGEMQAALFSTAQEEWGKRHRRQRRDSLSSSRDPRGR